MKNAVKILFAWLCFWGGFKAQAIQITKDKNILKPIGVQLADVPKNVRHWSAIEDQKQHTLAQIQALEESLEYSSPGSHEQSLIERQTEELYLSLQELKTELSHAITVNIEDYYDTTVSILSTLHICKKILQFTPHEKCVRACTETQCTESCDTDYNCEFKRQQGMGVFISPSSVLTNHHVIRSALWKENGKNANQYHKENDKYYKYIATTVTNHTEQETALKKIKWYNKDDDIALIELERPLTGTVQNMEVLIISINQTKYFQ